MIHVKDEQRLKIIYTSRDQNNATSLAKISLDLISLWNASVTRTAQT